MSLLDFFFFRNTNTANIAKKRLKIILTHNLHNISYCKYFIDLKKELFYVIDKYIKIAPKIITVKIKKNVPNTLVIKLHSILKKKENIY